MLRRTIPKCCERLNSRVEPLDAAMINVGSRAKPPAEESRFFGPGSSLHVHRMAQDGSSPDAFAVSSGDTVLPARRPAMNYIPVGPSIRRDGASLASRLTIRSSSRTRGLGRDCAAAELAAGARGGFGAAAEASGWVPAKSIAITSM